MLTTWPLTKQQIVMLSMCIVQCRFVYETEHFNGVGELLEILGR